MLSRCTPIVTRGRGTSSEGTSEHGNEDGRGAVTDRLRHTDTQAQQATSTEPQQTDSKAGITTGRARRRTAHSRWLTCDVLRADHQTTDEPAHVTELRVEWPPLLSSLCSSSSITRYVPPPPDPVPLGVGAIRTQGDRPWCGCPGCHSGDQRVSERTLPVAFADLYTQDEWTAFVREIDRIVHALVMPICPASGLICASPSLLSASCTVTSTSRRRR